jgi:hypothetical protein
VEFARNADSFVNLLRTGPLSLALTAIAADSLQPDLYRRVFRMHRVSPVLFRNFILA